MAIVGTTIYIVIHLNTFDRCINYRPHCHVVHKTNIDHIGPHSTSIWTPPTGTTQSHNYLHCIPLSSTPIHFVSTCTLYYHIVTHCRMFYGRQNKPDDHSWAQTPPLILLISSWRTIFSSLFHSRRRRSFGSAIREGTSEPKWHHHYLSQRIGFVCPWIWLSNFVWNCLPGTRHSCCNWKWVNIMSSFRCTIEVCYSNSQQWSF